MEPMPAELPHSLGLRGPVRLTCSPPRDAPSPTPAFCDGAPTCPPEVTSQHAFMGQEFSASLANSALPLKDTGRQGLGAQAKNSGQGCSSSLGVSEGRVKAG